MQITVYIVAITSLEKLWFSPKNVTLVIISSDVVDYVILFFFVFNTKKNISKLVKDWLILRLNTPDGSPLKM